MRRIGRRVAGLIAVLGILVVADATATAAAAGAKGWLDPTFSGDGIVVVPHTARSASRCGLTDGIAVAPTGRIFVGAVYCDVRDPDEVTPSEVVAFTASGRLDSGFHGGRPLLTEVGDGAGDVTMSGFFATSTGGLIAHIVNGASPCDRYRRWTPSGARDVAWGAFCVPSPSPGDYVGGPATRLPGGSIRQCIRSNFGSSDSDQALTGLTPDGKVDTRIGPEGTRAMEFGDCRAFASDANGRLYWGSRRWLPAGRAVIDVVRTFHTGDVDSSWGTAGVATIDVAGHHMKPVTIAPTPDGSVLVGLAESASPTGAPWHAAVAKLTATGTVDVDFGLEGMMLYGPPGGASRLLALTADASSRPILSAIFSSGGQTRAVVIRGFASTGVPDTEFGNDGIVTVTRPAVRLAMASATRLLLLTDVEDGLILSARKN